MKRCVLGLTISTHVGEPVRPVVVVRELPSFLSFYCRSTVYWA